MRGTQISAGGPAALGIAGTVLVVAAIMTGFVGRPSQSPRQKLPAGILPAEVAGYTVTDLPIAATETLASFAERELGYDDYLYRKYERSGYFVSVYIAFWQPERRHFFDIGTHAPDNCWVQNGWSPHPKLPRERFFSMRPAESRIFDKDGLEVRVYYWHLVGGHLIDYARYGRGRTLGFLFDNLRWYTDGRSEQYFIRVSTNMDPVRLRADAAFSQAMSALCRYTPLSRK